MARSDIVSGNLIIASELLGALSEIAPLVANKTGDTTITSSATLQDDTELALTVAANTTYVVSGWLWVTSTSATPDFKAAYTGPTGATMVNSLWGQGTGASSSVGSMDSGVATTISGVHARGAYNGTLTMAIFGTLTIGSTAGTFRLQWAQNTSDPAGVVVKAGSWLQLTPKS